MANNIGANDLNEIIAILPRRVPSFARQRTRSIRYADVFQLRRLSWLLAYLLERARRVATFACPRE
jgi:hypothetical protein